MHLFECFVAFLAFSVTLASAQVFDQVDAEIGQGEARTVFTSGGTYYLALNTTYLIYYGILLSLLFLALLALSGLAGGAEESGYSDQSAGYSRDSSSYQQDQPQRHRRFAYDNGK
jgi:hypothetical protein